VVWFAVDLGELDTSRFDNVFVAGSKIVTVQYISKPFMGGNSISVAGTGRVLFYMSNVVWQKLLRRIAMVRLGSLSV
jgi:hypothetical protein